MINDAYDALEKYIALERRDQIGHARDNLQSYDSILQGYLESFNNSEEFREFIKHHEDLLAKIEAVFLAWPFAIFSEVAIFLANVLTSRFRK